MYWLTRLCANNTGGSIVDAPGPTADLIQIVCRADLRARGCFSQLDGQILSRSVRDDRAVFGRFSWWIDIMMARISSL